MEVMSEEKIDNMIMKLTAYGLYTGLIENSDVVYIINQYIGMLGIDDLVKMISYQRIFYLKY